jgi:hypothetical protein
MFFFKTTVEISIMHKYLQGVAPSILDQKNEMFPGSVIGIFTKKGRKRGRHNILTIKTNCQKNRRQIPGAGRSVRSSFIERVNNARIT